MYDTIVKQKIAKQYQSTPLTDFNSVTPTTQLDDLNLNWHERDLPETERTKHVHRLHPYMGKFVPQLVEIFLRKYQPRLVYDPFVGSGTALVEANSLGIDTIGTDISIFNILLSKAKTAQYDLVILDKEIGEIIKKLVALRTGKIKPKIENKNEYLDTWFSENTKNELLFFKDIIQNYEYKDLYEIVLSRSARSARLITHFDLDFPKKPQTRPYYCFKHDRTCQPVNEAYKFLTRYLIDTQLRIKEFSKIRTGAKVTINHADSREVKLPKNIDMVFTSPPYIGLIDYHDQHKYAYELLGLENNEEKEIGPAKNGQSEQAKKEYIDGINSVFLHTSKHMTKDGLLLIVINDKYNLYKAEAIGFEQIGKVDRHVNRRTGRREGAFYESILIWKKKNG